MAPSRGSCAVVGYDAGSVLVITSEMHKPTAAGLRIPPWSRPCAALLLPPQCSAGKRRAHAVIPTGVPENELHNAKMRIDLSRQGGATGFCSGSSGAASKIIYTKIGQGAYLGLILIHTKFEKKSRGLTDVRHKSRTRKFTKIASARSPAAEGLYADPWVGTNRSDRSKPPQRRHSVGRT